MMGTTFQKIQYTVKAVDDIQKALEEKGFDMSDVELSRYGALIRLITGSSPGSGGSSSIGNEGQPLNGLKLDNIIFVSKSVQNITTKDISLNAYIPIKSVQILNKDELTKYQYPLLLSDTYFMQKDILHENILNITNNTTILSKEIIHVNIDNIIKQEE